MSDLTLLGVLRLPIECWDESDDEFGKLDKVQRHARYLQAADRIEADAARIAELEAQLEQPDAVTPPRGEPIPDTVEAWKHHASLLGDQIERDRETINRLRQENNKLRQRPTAQPPAVTDKWSEQWELMVDCAKWNLKDYGTVNRNDRGILYADSLIKALQGEGEV